MLILNRHIEESVEARLPDGNSILITFVGFRPDGSIKLGFEGPSKVEFIRSELSEGWKNVRGGNHPRNRDRRTQTRW